MRQDNIALNQVTLGILMEAHIWTKNWDQVKFLYKRYNRLTDSQTHNLLFARLLQLEAFDVMDEVFSPSKIAVRAKFGAHFDFHAWSLGVCVAALRHYLPMERGAR